MSWSGNGAFVRTNGVQSGARTWQQARDAGRNIRADDQDNHDEDIAQGLENCLTRDGQNAPSQNLPMNSKRHTGVQNAVNDSDYAAWGQAKTYVNNRTGDQVSNAEKTAGTVTAIKRFSPKDVADMIDRHASLDQLTEQASISWDVQASPVSQVTLGGNRTLANPTNPKNGGVYVIEAKQDSTGNRTLAYGNAYNFGEEGTPVLSTTASASDVLCFLYTDSEMKLISIVKGF